MTAAILGRGKSEPILDLRYEDNLEMRPKQVIAKEIYFTGHMVFDCRRAITRAELNLVPTGTSYHLLKVWLRKIAGGLEHVTALSEALNTARWRTAA